MFIMNEKHYNISSKKFSIHIKNNQKAL